MTVVAYLRRSSDRNGGAESYDAQRAAVLDLAARNGDPEPELHRRVGSQRCRCRLHGPRWQAQGVAAASTKSTRSAGTCMMEAVDAGLWSLVEVGSRLEAIHAERRQVEGRTVVADVPQEIDWSWEPAALNDVLHALWERVDVDLAAGTIDVVWRDSSLRRP